MIVLDEYDIQEAFAAIEEELIKSMMRNMKRHRVEEVTEDLEWTMWQAEQLKALELYKNHNQKAFKKQFAYINNSIDKLIVQSRKQGNLDQELEILEAIKNGFIPSRRLRSSVRTSAEFFKLNDRKLEALIKATKQDLQKAETAMLRMANDQYRKIIFNAQVYVNTGAATYEKAVDLAAKDFLTSGINCIEYKNGARVNIASYADMALRTANKRAYLTGEGEKRKEWGISTVIMNKRGAACPKCLPFIGKILIDDVWGGGKASDGPYHLMSNAIAKGLYHPNCKDSHTTYFEGITTPPKAITSEDVNEVNESYQKEQKQQYTKRQINKFSRLKEGSLDKQNRDKYELKEREWKSRLSEYESSNKGINKNTVINQSTINSADYRKKIEALGESKETTRQILNESKRMLYHRNGTEFEDLVFINSKSGEVLRSVDYEKIREAKPTKKMLKMLNQANKGEIIAIHNHPNSMPPSISDLIVAKQRGYKYGMITSHNGQVVKYTIVGDINVPIANTALAKLVREGYNNDIYKSLIDAGVRMEVW